MFNQIIQGNHLDVLRRYPDDCFDMFLTSPPYDNLRDYEGYDFQFEPLAHELYRTLKPGGVGVWIVNDATINGSETLTSFKEALYLKDDAGFNIHDTMFYEKNASPFPEQTRYYQIIEYMFILSKGKPLTVNLLKDRKNMAKRKHRISSQARKKNGNITKKYKEYDIAETGIRFNVWTYNTGYKDSAEEKFVFQHPAIFPEKLAEDHILSWSNPGDVILDPMCGSGTTCKMAVKHQRQYVGIDISEKYCELARTRLEKFTKQTTIFEVIPSMN